MLTIADPGGFVLFALVSILISLALVPVALTTSQAPQEITSARLDVRKLFHISPLAAFGTLSVGLANGAFWAIGAVYVLHIGFDTKAVALFMSTVIIAGAIAQWPLGHLSDHVDRRKVIVATTFLAGIGGIFLSATGASSLSVLLIGGALFGAFALALFGLCVAHANDFAKPDEFVGINGGLLLLFGLGAVFGPVLGPITMEVFGANWLFVYTAAVHFVLTAFGVLRIFAGRTVLDIEKEAYVAVPRTSPVVFELDPRAQEHKEAVN